jgi:hypothetical protein
LSDIVMPLQIYGTIAIKSYASPSRAIPPNYPLF